MNTIDVGQTDGLQLAFIQLGFQALTIGLNVGLLITQQVMAGLISIALGVVSGVFGQLTGGA